MKDECETWIAKQGESFRFLPSEEAARAAWDACEARMREPLECGHPRPCRFVHFTYIEPAIRPACSACRELREAMELACSVLRFWHESEEQQWKAKYPEYGDDPEGAIRAAFVKRFPFLAEGRKP